MPLQVGAILTSRAGAASERIAVLAEPLTAASPSAAVGLANEVPPCATQVLALSHTYQRLPLVASVFMYASPTVHVAGRVVECGRRNVRDVKSYKPGDGWLTI